MRRSQLISPAYLDSRPPAAGYYTSVITTARWRRSQRGNRMVYVVHALAGVWRPFDRVPDYFVVEGLSASGLAFARSRLVQLCLVCGLATDPDVPIRPSRLVGARLEVQVGHELWEGRPRLRVVGYRRCSTGPATGGSGTAGGSDAPRLVGACARSRGAA
jgi:hypothetical protein